MRLKMIVSMVLIIAATIVARTAPTVSGIAVAAQWNGGNDGISCGYGKIMKYVITNGATASRSILYNGPARAATLSTDGQRVAFINQNGTISYMSTSGGTPTVVVSGLTSTTQYMGWPDGNWLYYMKGGIDASNFQDSKELWKVDVTTKQTAKVTVFNPDSGPNSLCPSKIWQFDISKDGTRAMVRPDFGGCSRFLLASEIYLASYDTMMYANGCGAGISPTGTYLMNFTTTGHETITFYQWHQLRGGPSWPDWAIKTIPMGVMNNWGAWIGTGMNNNHWSCNDDKWLVLQTCWDGRYGNFGSNQVLCNWVDSQTIRTSDGDSTSNNPQQNESGDFWVGTPSTQQQVTTPAVSPNGGSFTDTITVQLSCATSGASIYYTIDGSTPDNTKQLYSTPVKLTATTTLKAIGLKSGMTASGILSVTFTKSSGTGNNSWAGIDLSGATPAGSFTAPSANALTITGGGDYWWAPTDRFYFVYKQVTGDCQIIAHCISSTGGTIGAMIRGGITGKDPNAAFHIWNTDGQIRSETYATDPTNGTEMCSAGGKGWYTDYWMKITRTGNLVRLYRANSATMPASWGTPDTVTLTDLPAAAYVGLAVMNGTAQFDNVIVTGPVAATRNVSYPRQNAAVATCAPVVKTEYYNLSGQRLTIRNGAVVAPAATVIIARRIDARGTMHSEKVVVK